MKGIVDKRLSYLRYLSTPNESFTKHSEDDQTVAPKSSVISTIESDNDIPPVDRFIFLSESCLPVATLDEAEINGDCTPASSKPR